jgi:hypothetical protein
MATFPKDQFDTFPEDLARQGAHRAPKKKGGGWLGFLAAVVATVVLIAGGLYGVSLFNDSFKFTFPGSSTSTEETPSATPTPEAAPILDPTTIEKSRKIKITILNGTTTAGIQDEVLKTLKAQKWPATSAVVASSSDIEDTFIYYSNPEDEDVARGLVIALGIGQIRESSQYLGAPVTIVLGSDYVDAQ